MKGPAFQPGTIWPGEPLTAATLERQWQQEFFQASQSLDLNELAFAPTDWADLEWNGRESLHLNARYPRLPMVLRALVVDQDRVNLHLIRSLQKVLAAWQQWLHLPATRSLTQLPSRSECLFLVHQAAGRLEQAEARLDSLSTGKQLFHQFSLRQWRLWQQVASLFNDLTPFITATRALVKGTPGREATPSLAEDVLWHTRECLLLLGPMDGRPALWERLRAPRFEVNRMLAALCLLHGSFLQTLIHS